MYGLFSGILTEEKAVLLNEGSWSEGASKRGRKMAYLE
jgi:hypothetical protein